MMDRWQHASPFWALGLLVGMAAFSHAAAPTAEKALALKPVQAGVDYEKVEPAKQSQCKVIDIDQGDWTSVGSYCFGMKWNLFPIKDLFLLSIDQ